MGRGVPPADGKLPRKEGGRLARPPDHPQRPQNGPASIQVPTFRRPRPGSLTVAPGRGGAHRCGDYAFWCTPEISGWGRAWPGPATWPRKAGRGPWRALRLFCQVLADYQVEHYRRWPPTRCGLPAMAGTFWNVSGPSWG